MEELNFGVCNKTYSVNGGAEISFNPADISFANRVYDLLKNLEERQKEKPPADIMDVFEVARIRDEQMRSDIDSVFGPGTCEKIFGSTNVFSPSGGIPLCMHFIMAVIDEIDAASEKETKFSPAVEAYMKKYESKYGKYVKK